MDSSTNHGSIAEKGESRLLIQKPENYKKEPEPLPLLQDWMSRIDSFRPISSLSIPGTHDSASFMSTWPFVSTQTMSTTQQLDAGIRYFDLRCGIIKDVVQMVHGRAVLGLELSVMLEDMYTWLEKHPTEALIVQIKQDRKDEASTLPFSDLVINLMTSKPKYWRLAPTTPTLGELRGHIQLLRRFVGKDVYRYGINVSRWKDNPVTPFTIHTYSGVNLTIQDHYSWSTAESLPSAVTKKGGDVYNLLVQAAADPEPWHWYINFSSAYEFNVYYQISPREIALGGYWIFRWVDGINISMNNTLKTVDSPQRLGVIMMDFPELPQVDLIKTVVDSNFESKKSKRPEIGMKLLSAMMVLLLLVIWAWFETSRVQEVGGRWCLPLLHACEPTNPTFR